MNHHEPYPTGILNRVECGIANYRVFVEAWLKDRGYTMDDPRQSIALHRCLTESSVGRYGWGYEGAYGVVVVKDGVVRVVMLGELADHLSNGWTKVN